MKGPPAGEVLAPEGTGTHHDGQVDTRNSNTAGALSVPDIDPDADNLTAALAWAKAAWYVLPVKRGTKDPGSVVGKRWQEKSSHDPKVIASWFAGTDCDIALHCGRSGAVVLDVDHPELVPEPWRPHLDSAPYQSTRPDTRRRGHYIYAMPAGRSIGNPNFPGGEVRGLNGVIMAANSFHKDGGEYRLVSTGAVPVLPDVIAQQLGDSSPGEDAATDAQVAAFLAEHTSADLPDAVLGPIRKLEQRINDGESRHDATVSVLVWAMDEAAAGSYPADDAAAAIKDVFMTAIATQRKPGDRVLDRAHAQSEWRGILAWSIGQANTKTKMELADIRVKAQRHVHQTNDNEADAQAADQSMLDKLSVTADWLDKQTFDKLEYAVPDVIPEGYGLLAGPPKKGKSFLVGNIGVAVASGGKAWQRIDVQRRPVLYLALEDGYRRLQDRLRRMNGGQPLPPNLTLIIKATPPEAVEAIREYLSRHGHQKPLIVVDTLGKIKRAKRSGEESFQADYEIGSQFKWLADSAPGSTVLVVHHTRKAASEDFVDSVSGTQGLAASADFVIVLARQRSSDDAVLSVTGRDVIESEYGLHADDGVLWRLQGDTLKDARKAAELIRRMGALESSHGRRAVQVVQYVHDGSRVVSPADIAAEFDLDAKRASELLARLEGGGFLTKLGRGEYGPGI